MKHHKRDSKKPSMRFTNMSYEPKGFSYEVFNCETLLVLFDFFLQHSHVIQEAKIRDLDKMCEPT